MDLRHRLGAVCGVLAPIAFVGGWLVNGARTPGYRPLEDAISQLAREGAATRGSMTVCFIVFGVLVCVWARTLARALRAPALLPVVVLAGVGTLAVAALPLTRAGGQPQDAGHAAAAMAGYVGMAATPLVAARALTGQARQASLAVGAVSVVALVGSVATGNGGLQRLGLTVVDGWHVAVACAVLLRPRP